MGLKTKQAYIDSIRQMKPTAYMFGEKIDSVVDNPRLRAGIEAEFGALRRFGRVGHGRRGRGALCCRGRRIAAASRQQENH